jgi:hypothetical protein
MNRRHGVTIMKIMTCCIISINMTDDRQYIANSRGVKSILIFDTCPLITMDENSSCLSI